jgi:hypothetical protein
MAVVVATLIAMALIALLLLLDNRNVTRAAELDERRQK